MKFMFKFFRFLYMIAPLVAIPYWAYSNDNWYLLFGIPFSYFGSYSSYTPRLKSFIFLFTIVCIGVWIGIGFSIHQYITFFFFCSLWGYLIAKIAEEYDQQSKNGNLENNAVLKKIGRQSLSDEVKMLVWQRDGGRCTNCGSQESLEYVHIVPVSKGGNNTAHNIHILCEKCNRASGAKIS